MVSLRAGAEAASGAEGELEETAFAAELLVETHMCPAIAGRMIDS